MALLSRFGAPWRRRAYIQTIYTTLLLLTLAAAVAHARHEKPTDATAHDYTTPALSGFAAPTHSRSPSEIRHQEKRIYQLVDHVIRICVYTFLSAIFAGLTLGVMCADTFTLEIIAESGPAPDSKYAATVLPLRKQGHKTLCTLIICNMLCNVLIVEEFSAVFALLQALRMSANHGLVEDASRASLYSFIVSNTVIVLFAEIIPMAICKSKYSLMVAAAGSSFVRIAMILTYPVSATLGWLLDWIIGTEEAGQIYDRNELRKLMMIHYEREGNDNDMNKTELNLLLSAMDFHDRRVRDVMTPIRDVTYVRASDEIRPDFIERLWLSGRSRVPVESAPGQFTDILLVKDLMAFNASPEFKAVTVEQVVKTKNRLFAMVDENTRLPAMLKFFQEAKTHMAVVFHDKSHDDMQRRAPPPETSAMPLPLAESDGGAALVALSTATGSGAGGTDRRRTAATTEVLGIITMEDVVEELLNDEIYDEYDRYASAESHVIGVNHLHAQLPTLSTNFNLADLPPEPKKPPRVNFYSYFTHPEQDIPLTDAQIWAVVYFLTRTVSCFALWPPGLVRLLLDECGDEQLVVPQSGTPVAPAPSRASHDLDSSSLSGDTQDKPSSFSSDHGAASVTTSLRYRRHALPNFVRHGDHDAFLAEAADEKFVLYRKDERTENFMLVLGGAVRLLVGDDGFPGKLRSFDFIAEKALTSPFYAPDFSAIVSRAARVYRIPKSKYDKYLSYVSYDQQLTKRIRVLSSTARDPERSSPIASRFASSSGSNERTASTPSHTSLAKDETSSKLYGTFDPV